ncbi:MAG: hypothetical protein AB1646_24800 [Thermodesulfobacteriota bacterium]
MNGSAHEQSVVRAAQAIEERKHKYSEAAADIENALAASSLDGIEEKLRRFHLLGTEYFGYIEHVVGDSGLLATGVKIKAPVPSYPALKGPAIVSRPSGTPPSPSPAATEHSRRLQHRAGGFPARQVDDLTLVGLPAARESTPWATALAGDCLDTLRTLATHCEITHRASAEVTTHDAAQLKPGLTAYANMQRMVVLYLDPTLWKSLRVQFVRAGLPTYGFDHPVEPPRSTADGLKEIALLAAVVIVLATVASVRLVVLLILTFEIFRVLVRHISPEYWESLRDRFMGVDVSAYGWGHPAEKRTSTAGQVKRMAVFMGVLIGSSIIACVLWFVLLVLMLLIVVPADW